MMPVLTIASRDPLVAISSLVIIALSAFILSRPDVSNVMAGAVPVKALIGTVLTAALLALMISVANQVYVNKKDAKGKSKENKGCAIPQTLLVSGAAIMLIVTMLAVPGLRSTVGLELAAIAICTCFIAALILCLIAAIILCCTAAAVFLCSIAAICTKITKGFAGDLNAELDVNKKSDGAADGFQLRGAAPSAQLACDELDINPITGMGIGCAR